MCSGAPIVAGRGCATRTPTAASTLLLALLALGPDAPSAAAGAMVGSRSPLLAEAVDLGRSAAGREHRLVVSLDLRNREALEAFLVDIQNPDSPDYQRFLTQEEFNAAYAPTPDEEAALIDHLEQSGLRVVERASNRLLVGVTGSTAAVERAFATEMHDVGFRGRRHFAALQEPSLPPALARFVLGVIGLDDLEEMRPHARPSGPVPAPHAALGSNCCHLGPGDLDAFYADAGAFDGSGETIVVAGAYAWKDTDNAAFSNQWGLPALPLGSGQVCTGSPGSRGCKFSSQNSIEIALDVEYAHATAPGARILNYMSASTSFADFTVMYNRIVADNPGRVVTTSWGACEAGVPAATQLTDDNIFANANAIGQSWFAASGDNGSRDCSNLLTVDNPANSPHVIGVGGTTPTCSSGMTPSDPACGGYGSETAWSGSGGGVSQLFSRPAFQAGCGVPPGSQRLVPDVSLESDTTPGNYVVENGAWYIVGGTSGAAPQWAGFLAQLVQKRGGLAIGSPGTLLYGLCGTTAFHDVTSGSNGDYAAALGYDLVTGLGTLRAQSFLALASPSVTTTTTSTSSTTTSTSSTTTSTATTSSTTTSTTTTSSTTTTTAPPPTTTTSSTTSTASTSTSTTTAPPPTTTTSSTTSTSTTTSTTAPPPPTTTSSTTTTTSTTSTTAPPGTCASPRVIPAAGGTATGTTAGASAVTGCASATASAPEQVFVWTPAASGTATIATCGAGTTFDTVVSVRSGGCAGAVVGCNDDSAGCGTGDGCTTADHHGSRVTLAVTAGQPYVIVVDGFAGSCGGASGNFVLSVVAP